MEGVKCKNCYNWQKEKPYWCNIVCDSLDENDNRDCQHFRVMTNGDRIRRMTDGELTQMLGKFLESASCWNCPIYETQFFETECSREHEDDEGLPSCGDIVAMWLKQEVKND